MGWPGEHVCVRLCLLLCGGGWVCLVESGACADKIIAALQRHDNSAVCQCLEPGVYVSARAYVGACALAVP